MDGGGMKGSLGALGCILDVLNPKPAWVAAAQEMVGRIDAAAREHWTREGSFFG